MTPAESSRGPSVSRCFDLRSGAEARLDALLRDHSRAWAARWERRTPDTAPDAELQCALQYAEFQLLCSCSGRDPTVSIGARGLTHGRYKGCHFSLS